MKPKITRRRALATIGAGAAARSPALPGRHAPPSRRRAVGARERVPPSVRAAPYAAGRDSGGPNAPRALLGRLFALDNQMAETPAPGLDGVAVTLRRPADPNLGIEAGLSDGHPPHGDALADAPAAARLHCAPGTRATGAYRRPAGPGREEGAASYRRGGRPPRGGQAGMASHTHDGQAQRYPGCLRSRSRGPRERPL